MGYIIGIDVLRNQKAVDFKWSRVPEANAYIFTLYQEDSGGRRQINRTAPENRNAWTLDDISKLDRGKYTWQVEAVSIKQDGSIERRGDVGENSFTVDIPRPGAIRTEKPGTERPTVQRLAWNRDNYSLRYEAVIEKEEGKDYRQIKREFTAENFIEVSLPPGKYRFRVIPYDYQDKPGEGSEWTAMSIEALDAVKPELDRGRTEIFYSDNTTQVLSILGNNLLPGAEIYLRARDGKQIVPKEVQITDDGTNAMLIFEKDQLVSGTYEIIVRNPGGMETNKTGVRINNPRGN